MIYSEPFILGSLIVRPSILDEIPELSLSFFTSERNKKIFKAIIDLRENNGEISEVGILAKIETHGLKYEDLAELQRGIPLKVKAADVQDSIRSIKKQRIAAELLREAQNLHNFTTKGGEPDFEKAAEIIGEAKALDSKNEIKAYLPLSDVEAKSIFWLWRGRLPLGMFSLFVGDPGVGKSICSISIASRLSRGLALPDSDGTQPCSTLFILGEDPLAQAVRPRADANGADCKRLIIFQDDFRLNDTGKIEGVIEEKNIKFIILDPLTAFFPEHSRIFEDPAVRQTLLPLVAFAENKNVSVLGIAHFRKQEAEAAIYRVSGSVGLAGIARSIFAVVRDEEERDRRLLISIKNNYARKPPSLAFKIGDDLRVNFEDSPVETDVEHILGSSEKKAEIEERNFVDGWLKDFLRDGRRDTKEIIKNAKEADIPRRTLFRAAKRLKLQSQTSGYGKMKITHWGLKLP